MTRHLAMWSGPRNISTAMMRSWENRPDCEVVDEPFYACYLSLSGADHPMRDEVIASQSSDWQKVVSELTTDLPGVALHYQKHMTHHMLPEIDLSWTRQLSHCFLIRNPEEVVSSYVQKREIVTTEDIGIVRQLELYDEISRISSQAVPVIDSKRFLTNPEAQLKLVCNHFGIEFNHQMLEWPAGRRNSDGIWAAHWYQAVEASTKFGPPNTKPISLTLDQQAVVDESMSAYSYLLNLAL